MYRKRMKDLTAGDRFMITEDDDRTYTFHSFQDTYPHKSFTLINELGKHFESDIPPTIYVFVLESGKDY